MCRFCLYVGQNRIKISTITIEPSHSLINQSFEDPFLPDIKKGTIQYFEKLKKRFEEENKNFFENDSEFSESDEDEDFYEDEVEGLKDYENIFNNINNNTKGNNNNNNNNIKFNQNISTFNLTIPTPLSPPLSPTSPNFHKLKKCSSKKRINKNKKKKDARNTTINADGFGIGWYNVEIDKIPATFKSISPVWSNENLLSFAPRVQSKVIFSHVRAASQPVHVSRSNCHPFQKGRYLFMHNGNIHFFKYIKKQLIILLDDDIFNKFEGGTDSEFLFSIFLQQLRNLYQNQNQKSKESKTQTSLSSGKKHNNKKFSFVHTDVTLKMMKKALKKSIVLVLKISKEFCEKNNKNYKPSSINVAISDGDNLVVSRFRNSTTSEPPSLYFSIGYGIDINCEGLIKTVGANDNEMKETIHNLLNENKNDKKTNLKKVIKRKMIIVCSEPLNYQKKQWTLVPKNTFLCYKRTSGYIKLKSIDLK